MSSAVKSHCFLINDRMTGASPRGGHVSPIFVRGCFRDLLVYIRRLFTKGGSRSRLELGSTFRNIGYRSCSHWASKSCKVCQLQGGAFHPPHPPDRWSAAGFCWLALRFCPPNICWPGEAGLYEMQLKKLYFTSLIAWHSHVIGNTQQSHLFSRSYTSLTNCFQSTCSKHCTALL